MTKNIHNAVIAVKSNTVILCDGFVQRLQNSLNPSKITNSVRFKGIAKLKSNNIMQYPKVGKNSDSYQRDQCC